MIRQILENKINLIYEYSNNEKLSSFCIGFDAGAFKEKGYNMGVAHAVEHMLFKGSKKRSEIEINKLCDEYFGFCNAMTNYPYVIYYGTTLTEDFQRGFEIYSDIILNPAFDESGLIGEMEIIKEELKEWKDDISDFCQHELLNNAFESRRIKEYIIGTSEDLNKITLEELKKFYQQFYTADNCTITVVSSLPFTEIKAIVEKYFGFWQAKSKSDIGSNEVYEDNISGVFVANKKDIEICKIAYLLPIHKLDSREIIALKVFNHIFGEGTSSILYNSIRTENSIAYEVYSEIMNEKGIKLFSIVLGTSIDKVDKAIEIIGEIFDRLKSGDIKINRSDIKAAIRMIKLKRQLRLEKSIEVCKEFTTNAIMFDEVIDDEMELLDEVDELILEKVIKSLLVEPSIQIVKNC